MDQVKQEIDDASYQEGRADFDNGVSIRQMIEHAQRFGGLTDAKAMSAALGFVDAALDRLRGPRFVEVGSITAANTIETTPRAPLPIGTKLYCEAQ